ncbi:ovomucoid-like [Rhinatrema bivittatum]|uniref:ovomucoid-like n=1 Tax=Rhinatrema bivittatum TaxID=194408 RepID=UPI00112E3939|nr:ovomucoid-like [Rhinatrema bivittatum]
MHRGKCGSPEHPWPNCSNQKKEACFDEHFIICGTDAQQYDDECDFCKAKEKNAMLRMLHHGPCKFVERPCSLWIPSHLKPNIGHPSFWSPQQDKAFYEIKKNHENPNSK